MELYDDGKVGKALESHFVETHVGDGLHIYEDRTQVGDIVFITADKFKKYISIEWIEKKLNCCDNINAEVFIKAFIREWENNEWLQ